MNLMNENAKLIQLQLGGKHSSPDWVLNLVQLSEIMTIDDHDMNMSQVIQENITNNEYQSRKMRSAHTRAINANGH